MASNPPRHVDLFTNPNGQTVNTAALDLSLTGGTSGQALSSLWDDSAMDTAGPVSLSATQTTLSLGSFSQAAANTPLMDMSPNPSTPSRPSVLGQSRQISTPRRPRARDRHGRKRLRLSTDSTPFNSVDYWIQFDNDNPLSDVPEVGDPSKPEDAKEETLSAQQ
ncbi:hypothetical protein F5883DRAFT_587482 [Diaporthe sp. PMI_573]|nr:hypothetical protein F5883DRAFT_587482 [Diaporthaceae sp. PMI_573]